VESNLCPGVHKPMPISVDRSDAGQGVVDLAYSFTFAVTVADAWTFLLVTVQLLAILGKRLLEGLQVHAELLVQDLSV